MPFWTSKATKIAIVFVLFSLVFSWFYLYSGGPRVDNLEAWGQIPAGEIVKDYTISQSFISHGDGLTGVAVRFATYQRRNSGTLNFTLYKLLTADGREEKVKLLSGAVSASELTDGAFETFSFNPVSQSENSRYLFTISSPDSDEGNAVTVFLSEGKSNVEGKTYIGGTSVRARLNFVTYIYQTNRQMMINFLTGKSRFKSVANSVSFYFAFFLLLFLVSYLLVNSFEVLKESSS